LTRQSIFFATNLLVKSMDPRVKPAGDAWEAESKRLENALTKPQNTRAPASRRGSFVCDCCRS
jgi:hypothetical protein